MTALYDTIGIGYRDYRRPDPRIAAAIIAALGDARTIVNIGAGAGSYEPADRDVVAVEPSETMIRQRARNAAPVVCASAMDLPFRDDTFDAALACLTVHHWPDQARGLREMQPVACRCVILTWEPSISTSWLTRDYFPEIVDHDSVVFLPVSHYAQLFPKLSVVPLPVPHDCIDGFLEAYWRRPEAYFDRGVRNAISAFAHDANVETGLAALRRDLDDSTWMRRNGHLLELTQLNLGYCIVIGERPTRSSGA